MEYYSFENRDVRCASDVGRMATLGRFDVEFVVYGCASIYNNGEIYYRATSKEKKLFDYIGQQRLAEVYSIPIIRLVKRSKVPSGMKEQIMQEIKYELVQKMKRQYENGYFEIMQPFFQTEANDNAYCPLKDYAERIYGHFDDAELQLFNGALLIAFEAKVLTKTRYQQLKAWHDHTRRQMADDPIIEDNICRTFYGFVYERKDGTRDCFFDAQEMTVVHHQQEIMLHGEFVGPIVQKSYWFQQFDQMGAIRQSYRKWLMNAENEDYFQLLKAIRGQQGVIDKKALCLVSKKLIDHSEAHAAIGYYDAIWNKK